jgi:phosphoribosylformylglycinamidine (FGAM) synthase PurS component
MMPTANLQQIIDRLLVDHATETDLQALISAIQSGQVILATADRSIAIGGNVSNSVIITGENNQAILLTDEAAIALEQILQQWQPKQGRYVQSKDCQNRQERDRYLEGVLHRLEQLADEYRQMAEERQNIGWDAVERSDAGETITKRYHVILHYERIAEDESKFETMHNTIMGNTVVENAKITVITIDSDLPVERVERSWI